jgi:hypothetical protein
LYSPPNRPRHDRTGAPSHARRIEPAAFNKAGATGEIKQLVSQTGVDAASSFADCKAHLIVLEAIGIVEIDFTAAQILSDVVGACRSADVDFAIARLESIRAQDAIGRFGIGPLLAAGKLFHSVEEAISAWRGETQTGKTKM